MSKPEDLALIARVTLFDDKQAFNKLVLKYQSSVRRFLLNLTMGDSMWSDDLAQDTFIKAYLHLQTFQGISGFSTWLFSIAYRTFYDSVRTKRLQTNLDHLENSHEHQSLNNFNGLELDLHKAMSILKPAERTAILLFYMEDRSQKEIAKIMELPLGTVKTHLLKGKERLGQFLENSGYERTHSSLILS